MKAHLGQEVEVHLPHRGALNNVRAPLPDVITSMSLFGHAHFSFISVDSVFAFTTATLMQTSSGSLASVPCLCGPVQCKGRDIDSSLIAPLAV